MAATIGVYSVVDAKGIRSVDTPLYAAASFMCITVTTTIYALGTGRAGEMVVADADVLASISDHGNCLGHHLRVGADRV